MMGKKRKKDCADREEDSSQPLKKQKIMQDLEIVMDKITHLKHLFEQTIESFVSIYDELRYIPMTLGVSLHLSKNERPRRVPRTS